MDHTFSNALIAIAMIILAVVVAWEVRLALRSGIMKLGGWPVAIRQELPLWFWFCMAFQTAVGGFCLWVGIRAAMSLLS